MGHPGDVIACTENGTLMVSTKEPLHSCASTRRLPCSSEEAALLGLFDCPEGAGVRHTGDAASPGGGQRPRDAAAMH